MNDWVVYLHLKGVQSYGIFLLMDGLTSAVAVDFDQPDANPPVEFIHRAHHWGFPAYLEISKSKGYHVWMFSDAKGVSARKARWIAHRILEEMELPNIEVFPKQDRLEANQGFGNFINAPLFGSLVLQGRTVFVNPGDLQPYPNQWEFLASIQRVTEDQLDKIIAVNQGERPVSVATNAKSPQTTAFSLPPCAKQMLADGVTQNQRVACFRLAIHFRKIGVPFDIATAALKEWAKKNRPIGGKRILTAQEIVGQVQAAYQSSYTGCGCNDPAVSPYCQPECPIYVKQERLFDSQTKGGDSHDGRV